MNAIHDIITELIRKECEAYKLISLRLLPSVEAGVDQVIARIGRPDDTLFSDYVRFREWRQEVLRLFYETIAYAGYLQEEGRSASFRLFMSDLRKRIVGRLRQEYPEETLDKELAVPPHTLAFRLSAMLEEELFQAEAEHFPTVVQPSALYDVCRQICRNYFPIGLPELLLRLRKNDTGFWDTFYLTIKRLTEMVTHRQYLTIQYKKEIMQDTWSDASLFLQRKMEEGELPEFESPLHFRNYIARICLNKMREAIRKNCSAEMPLDISGGIPEVAFQLVDDEKSSEASLQILLEDADGNDEEELGRILTVILWDKAEPWYSQLTRGMEEKTQLLFMHYAEGLRYDAIAAMQGKGLTEKELKRLENKLRQDVVRTRRLLKERFMNLLDKKGVR